MDKRILELAIEALEVRKAKVEAEIEAMQKELGGSARTRKAAPAVGRSRRRTAAQRAAHSRRMKEIWAARRRAASGRKFGPQSAEAREAQSKRMKAYWAKRRKEGIS